MKDSLKPSRCVKSGQCRPPDATEGDMCPRCNLLPNESEATPVSDESLRNVCNDTDVSTNIKEYFWKYPHSRAKECCRVLGLSFELYGGRTRKIKHDLSKWKQSVTPVTDENGRPLKPLAGIHREEYRFREPVHVGYVAFLREKAQSCRAKGAWYRSTNRNRQLEYFSDDVSIRVYPKSGTCRILPRRRMMFEELRVCVDDAFANALPTTTVLSDSYKHMIEGLITASRHRVFHVGPIAPFRVDSYRNSLGLSILSDASHPEHLEIHENWPPWIPILMEFQRNQNWAIESNTRTLSEFASQIKLHLSTLEGINTAVGRLSEAIRDFRNTIRSYSDGRNGNDSAGR